MNFSFNELRTKLVQELGNNLQADSEAERIMNLIHTDKRDDNMIVLSEADIQAIGEEGFRLLDRALHECGMKKSTHYN